MPPKLGDECFYVDEHGRKRDDWFQEEILSGLTPGVEARLYEATVKRAKEMHGFDDDAILRLYGPHPLLKRKNGTTDE
ncbi:MAG TPA: hypothetical protein VGJ20_37635 [Xanthobacteraceae bacterium]|jgi:hypothetical protein